MISEREQHGVEIRAGIYFPFPIVPRFPPFRFRWSAGSCIVYSIYAFVSFLNVLRRAQRGLRTHWHSRTFYRFPMEIIRCFCDHPPCVYGIERNIPIFNP